MEALLEVVRGHGVPAAVIGRVGAPFGELRIRTRGAGIAAAIPELARVYQEAIPRRMDGTPADVMTTLESEVAQIP